MTKIISKIAGQGIGKSSPGKGSRVNRPRQIDQGRGMWDLPAIFRYRSFKTERSLIACTMDVKILTMAHNTRFTPVIPVRMFRNADFMAAGRHRKTPKQFSQPSFGPRSMFPADTQRCAGTKGIYQSRSLLALPGILESCKDQIAGSGCDTQRHHPGSPAAQPPLRLSRLPRFAG